MADHDYIAAGTEAAFERTRLSLLQQLWDPATRRRLEAVGPSRGWRCLEVGGGAGSITRWLAERVGPEGSVLATDIDPRLLEAGEHANVRVCRHDILEDAPEQAAFDLVHCRSLLLHLSDPARAVRNMVRALRTGGWLVVEEPDYSSLSAVDPAHESAAWFDETWRGIRRTLTARGIVAIDFGRRVLDVVRASGLIDTGAEGTCWIVHGGTTAATFARMHQQLLVRAGALAPDDAARLDGLCQDPEFAFVDATLFAAWGRQA
jgi:SAM-dependent methyltransferase